MAVVTEQDKKIENHNIGFGGLLTKINTAISGIRTISVDNNMACTFKLLSNKKQLSPVFSINTSEDNSISLPRPRGVKALIMVELWNVNGTENNFTGRYTVIGIAFNTFWKERWAVKTEEALSLLEEYIAAASMGRVYDNIKERKDLYTQQSNLAKSSLRYIMFSGDEKEKKTCETLRGNYGGYLYSFSGSNIHKDLKKFLEEVSRDLYERYKNEDGLGF
jgi:hypothetical protein